MSGNKPSPGNDKLLMTVEAARLLRLSPRTLERLRVKGTGPRYMKAGAGIRTRVLYHPDDVQDWVSKRFTSTSEYGA
jgi:hypothetical protein